MRDAAHGFGQEFHHVDIAWAISALAARLDEEPPALKDWTTHVSQCSYCQKKFT
jgi:hypothetical protein